MWACIFYCLVILLNVLDLRVCAATNSSEKIADVIKNISRVNNVLQQLIQNYEHLQKIYKSQEVVDQQEYNVRGKNDTHSKKKPFSGTTMFVSDDENSSTESSDDTNEHKVRSVIKSYKVENKLSTIKTTPVEREKEPRIIFVDTHKKVLKKHGSQKISKADETTKKTRFSIQDSIHEKEEKTKIKHFSPYTDIDTNLVTRTELLSETTRKVRNRFLPNADGKRLRKDTAIEDKLDINNAVTARTIQISGMKERTKNTNGLIVLSGANTNPNTSNLKSNFKLYNIRNKSPIDKRKQNVTNTHIVLAMGSESGAKEDDSSIMDSSIDQQDLARFVSKTSILRKEYGDACLKLVVQKCYKACQEVLQNACRRSCKDKFKDSYDRLSRTGCIQSFVPNDAVKSPKNGSVALCAPLLNDEPTSLEESDKDEEKDKIKETVKRMKKKKKPILRGQCFDFDSEIFKTLQPIDRITLKLLASKSTLKAACRRTSCKKVVKTKFRNNYKEKCNELFAPLTLRIADGINDKAHGYLTAVCQQTNNDLPKPLTIESRANATAEKELDILRNRYEKACLKTSQEKCTDACNFAYTKACEEHSCKKKNKEIFRKECQRQCKRVFRSKHWNKKNRSSSSSSSSDDSSSDSS